MHRTKTRTTIIGWSLRSAKLRWALTQCLVAAVGGLCLLGTVFPSIRRYTEGFITSTQQAGAVDTRICYERESWFNMSGELDQRFVLLLSDGEIALVTLQDDPDRLHILEKRSTNKTYGSSSDAQAGGWIYVGIAVSCDFLYNVMVSGSNDALVLHCLERESRFHQGFNRTMGFELSVVKLFFRTGRYSWVQDKTIFVEPRISHGRNSESRHLDIALSFHGETLVTSDIKTVTNDTVRVYRRAPSSKEQATRWTVQNLDIPIKLDRTFLVNCLVLSGDGKTLAFSLTRTNDHSMMAIYQLDSDGAFRWRDSLVRFKGHVLGIYSDLRSRAMSFDGLTLATSTYHYSYKVSQPEVLIFDKLPSGEWHNIQIINSTKGFIGYVCPLLSSSGLVLLVQNLLCLKVFSRSRVYEAFYEQPETYYTTMNGYHEKLGCSERRHGQELGHVHMVEDASSFVLPRSHPYYYQLGVAYIFRRSVTCSTTTRDQKNQTRFGEYPFD